MIVGALMPLEQAFSDRFQQYQFPHQEWGLILTATEFELFELAHE